MAAFAGERCLCCCAGGGLVDLGLWDMDVFVVLQRFECLRSARLVLSCLGHVSLPLNYL